MTERFSPTDDIDPRLAAGLAASGLATPEGTVFNLFGQLGESPGMLMAYCRLGSFFRTKSVLPPKWREAAILRTSARTGAAYEWQHHEGEARELGLSDPDLAHLAGTGSGEGRGVDPDVALVARYVDSVVDRVRVDDATWQACVDEVGRAGVIELTALSGFYSLTAEVLRNFDVPLDLPAD